MTTTPQPPSRSQSGSTFDTYAADFSRAMGHLDRAATKELDRADIDPRLRELIRIRASQLNGCAYCIDMHTKDARAIGETEQRLYALPAWRETPVLHRPGAGCAGLHRVGHPDGRRPRAGRATTRQWRPNSAPDEVAALVSLIVAINAWNAIGVATRAWEPGSYQP